MSRQTLNFQIILIFLVRFSCSRVYRYSHHITCCLIFYFYFQACYGKTQENTFFQLIYRICFTNKLSYQQRSLNPKQQDINHSEDTSVFSFCIYRAYKLSPYPLVFYISCPFFYNQSTAVSCALIQHGVWFAHDTKTSDMPASFKNLQSIYPLSQDMYCSQILPLIHLNPLPYATVLIPS